MILASLDGTNDVERRFLSIDAKSRGRPLVLGMIELGSARVETTSRSLAHPSPVDLVLQAKAKFDEARSQCQ